MSANVVEALVGSSRSVRRNDSIGQKSTDRLPNDGDGHGRPPHDLFGHAAEQDAGHPVAAVIADHDVVDVVLLRVLDDLAGGFADGDLGPEVDLARVEDGLDLRRKVRPGLLAQLFEFLAGELDARVDQAVGAVEHAQEDDLLVLEGSDRVFEGFLGGIGAVEGDEYRHGSPFAGRGHSGSVRAATGEPGRQRETRRRSTASQAPGRRRCDGRHAAFAPFRANGPVTPQLLEERVRTLTRPSLAAAEDAITDAIERGALLTAVGRCTVEYDGRAASTLGAGDRHLMIKPDGTVMVHTDEGRQPVNWQPPGCTCAVERDGDGGPNDRRTGDGRIEDGRSETGGADDRLVIRSTRSSPDEALSVSFERVFQVSAFDLTDEAELALTGTHEDLRRRVLADPDLVEPGVSPIATERDTAAGAVDIYGEDADGNPVVLELKRSRAGPDAVGQLDRYVAAVDREPDVDGPVRGVLVAPSATDRARRMLEERRLEFVALEPEADGRR